MILNIKLEGRSVRLIFSMEMTRMLMEMIAVQMKTWERPDKHSSPTSLKMSLVLKDMRALFLQIFESQESGSQRNLPQDWGRASLGNSSREKIQDSKRIRAVHPAWDKCHPVIQRVVFLTLQAHRHQAEPLKYKMIKWKSKAIMFQRYHKMWN